MEIKYNINVNIDIQQNADYFLLFEMIERLEKISSEDIDEKMVEFLKIDKESLNNISGIHIHALLNNLNNKLDYLINSYDK